VQTKNLTPPPVDQYSIQRDDGKNVAHPLKASEHDRGLLMDTLVRGNLTKSTFRELCAQWKRKLHEELIAQYELEKQREKCPSKTPGVEASQDNLLVLATTAQTVQKKAHTRAKDEITIEGCIHSVLVQDWLRMSYVLIDQMIW